MVSTASNSIAAALAFASLILDSVHYLGAISKPAGTGRRAAECPGGTMSSVSMAKPPALVVGTGFGCRIHVPALRAAGFEVVGLVGTDADRTRRRAESNGVAQVFTDLNDAIARTGA